MSVQKVSSPKVSKRKICLAFGQLLGGWAGGAFIAIAAGGENSALPRTSRITVILATFLLRKLPVVHDL